MSEQQPLLPSYSDNQVDAGQDVGKFTIYRKRTAEVLDHRYLHRAVIMMVRLIPRRSA